MKRFLRFLIVLIVVIVGGVLILGLIQPTEVTVQRSAVINAPKESVYNHVTNFKNWPKWSPWYQLDSTAKITYSGEDGKVGSAYHWEGDDKKSGAGDMRNEAMTGDKMNYSLHFDRPFKSDANGFFKVSDTTGGATKISWSITMHSSYPKNAMYAFMNMDKMLGADFEKGLNNLKRYVEASAPQDATAIKEIDFPEHIYAGVRKTMAWKDMMGFFASTYPMVGKEIGPMINGNAAGLFYKWDTVNHQGDIAAVFPVKDATQKLKGATYFNVPASKAYMAVHKGPYEGSGKVHTALMKHTIANGKNMGLVIEEYVTGPYQEKDSTKWVTNIYYLHQ